MNCDFCFAPNPVHTLPCRDFVVWGSDFKSTGAFLACDDCLPIITTGDVEALLEHAKARYLARHTDQEWAPEITIVLRHFYRDFFKNRI